MQTITSSTELKNAIRLLEAEHEVKQQILKEQFYLTYDSLKPVNLLRRTMHDISSSPDLLDDLLGTSMGLVSGYLSKKIFVGSSGNIFRKLLGIVVQYGISAAVKSNSGGIKSFIQRVIKYIIEGREAGHQNS